MNRSATASGLPFFDGRRSRSCNVFRTALFDPRSVATEGCQTPARQRTASHGGMRAPRVNRTIFLGARAANPIHIRLW
jgi:hypothetical protein